MRATMAAVAALAGGLFLLATAHGPASATSVPINLKNVIGTTPGSVELVRQGGGGGGGGGGGHGGGGGRYSGGGGGGGGAAIRGGGGGGPRVGAGPRGGGNFANRSGGRNYSGQRSYAGRNIDRSGPRASRDYGGDRGRYADRNRGDHRRYAERGRDNNHNNHNYRHRVWRNGAWVWIYGPDYYYDNYAYGGDCYWLRQQAYATGSPYWWSRYNACVGYY
jgi:hypothetical protein